MRMMKKKIKNIQGMKRLIIYLQLILIIFALSACSDDNRKQDKSENENQTEMESQTSKDSLKEENESQSRETESDEETTTEEKETIDYDNLVTDAYKEKIGESEYAIPKINLNSKEMEKLNAQIWDEIYENYVKNAEDEYNLGHDTMDEKITYDWNVQDDILSVCVEYSLLNYPYWNYYTYNAFISESKQCTDEELAAFYGMTLDEYYELARKAMYSFFCDYYSEGKSQNVNSDYFIAMANEQLSKTIADENVKEAKPFINTEGQLCIACRIYSLAGADSYEHIINLEEFEENENYPELYEMPKEQQDLLSEEEALKIAEEKSGYYDGQTEENEYKILFFCFGIYEYNGRNTYVFSIKKYYKSGAPVYEYVGTAYVDTETGECTISPKMFNNVGG